MSCEHLGTLVVTEPTTTAGCEDCIPVGATWVHLRMCMSCGHVGCCDSSPNQHATKHYRATEHQVVQSFEPGERWAYCYPDGTMLADVGTARDRHY